MNEVAALRERIEYLEEENLQLKEKLRGNVDHELASKFAVVFGLTRKENKIVCTLFSGGMKTEDYLYDVLYGDLPETRQPEIKIVSVLICKLRKKFRPHGVVVENIWGQGYILRLDMRQHILDILALEDTNG